MIEKIQQIMTFLAVAAAIGAVAVFLRAHPGIALLMAMTPAVLVGAALLIAALIDNQEN